MGKPLTTPRTDRHVGPQVLSCIRSRIRLYALNTEASTARSRPFRTRLITPIREMVPGLRRRRPRAARRPWWRRGCRAPSHGYGRIARALNADGTRAAPGRPARVGPGRGGAKRRRVRPASGWLRLDSRRAAATGPIPLDLFADDVRQSLEGDPVKADAFNRVATDRKFAWRWAGPGVEPSSVRLKGLEAAATRASDNQWTSAIPWSRSPRSTAGERRHGPARGPGGSRQGRRGRDEADQRDP